MTLKGICLAGAALWLAATVGVAAAQADVTVGNADSGNCYPFSCGPTDGLTEYQQAYNPSAFSGPITFDKVSFSMWTGANFGPMDSGTYSVSFFLSTQPVGSLSSNLASNEGTFLGSFGTFNLSGSMPSVLTLNGSKISYNPAAGTLLMDVGVSNGSSASGFYNVFFNADYTGVSTSRAWNSSIYGAFGNSNGALQTTFGAAVPEPATWATMLIGLGAIGAAMRSTRRKTGLAAVAV
jgi:hypothetical protein